jgi:hypothetical protein
MRKKVKRKVKEKGTGIFSMPLFLLERKGDRHLFHAPFPARSQVALGNALAEAISLPIPACQSAEVSAK